MPHCVGCTPVQFVLMAKVTLLLLVGLIVLFGVASVLVIEVITTVWPAAVTSTLNVATPVAFAVTETGVCGTPLKV
jgi:hypothetical protein